MAMLTANAVRTHILRRSLLRSMLPLQEAVPPIVMPYTLDFLNANWRHEDGAVWTDGGAGVFDSVGLVTYDAFTTGLPTWRVFLINVTKTISGDIRLFGYTDPFAAAPDESSMQVIKYDGPPSPTATGYGAQVTTVGSAVGAVGVFKNIAGVVTTLQVGITQAVTAIGGVWLKVEDLGGGTVRLRVWVRETGVWVLKLDINDSSAAASVATGPTWGFTNTTDIPLLSAQVYNATKVELTSDGALV